MLKLRSMRVLGTLALIGVSSACSDSTEPEAGPQTLAIVSGNAQTAPASAPPACPRPPRSIRRSPTRSWFASRRTGQPFQGPAFPGASRPVEGVPARAHR